jgi:glycosyltransferase involved in cell wall biosynthesis
MDDALPRVLGIIDGEPFHPLTWSGTSRRLFGALRDQGALAGAVDVGSRPVEIAARIASFSPRRRRWHQRYHASTSALAPVLRGVRTTAGRRRIVASGIAFDAAVQIGAWYDFSGAGQVAGSYHDGNLATFLRRPDTVLDASSRSVRRALDAERRVYERMDVILPMSAWLGRSFVEDFGVDPAKVVVAGAGPNFDVLPEAPAYRDWSRPRFLFVGKGDWARKGGPALVRAFEQVRAGHPDAELWVVGQPPRDDVPAGVRWIGRIARDEPGGEERLATLYRDATAFVLPSIYEPFGIALLEAMAYGLPCVASDTCAMPEIVADGETGYVAAPGDSAALAERLAALARDPAGARRLGEAGRARLLERYTWPAVATRITGALRDRMASTTPSTVAA